MATYVEYMQEDGSVLLVEVDQSAGEAIKAADSVGNTIVKSEQKFKDALKAVKSSVHTIWQELADLQINEGEITFGIKTTGELGVFAVCKASTEINYEIKLRWTKKAEAAPNP